MLRHAHIMTVEGACPSFLRRIEQSTSGDLSAANTPLSTSAVGQAAPEQHHVRIGEHYERPLTFAPLTGQHGSRVDWTDDSEDDNAILPQGESLPQVAEYELRHENRAPFGIAAVRIPAQPGNAPLCTCTQGMITTTRARVL